MRLVLIAALLLAVPAGFAIAGGFGGIGVGGPYFQSAANGPLMGVSSVTAFGYSVNDEGDRVGGFGLGLFTPAGSAEGGAGGLLAGHEWRLGPAFLALNLWGGVGGLRSGDMGYLLVFGQADLEIGILWLPWMEITFYAGYQTWGNLFPGVPFASAVSAAPILGMRMAWGGR